MRTLYTHLQVFVSKWEPLKPSVIEKWRVELSGASTGGGGAGDAAPAIGKRYTKRKTHKHGSHTENANIFFLFLTSSLAVSCTRSDKRSR